MGVNPRSNASIVSVPATAAGDPGLAGAEDGSFEAAGAPGEAAAAGGYVQVGAPALLHAVARVANSKVIRASRLRCGALVIDCIE